MHGVGRMTMAGEDFAGRLRALCALLDVTRRRLYDYVVLQQRSVSRDEASAALGIERSLVAYHLDALLRDGLLIASFARPDGRSGPGAGRPTKFYARAPAEFSVSVPSRDYELAAELLARAVERDTTDTVRGALHHAAADVGREVAARHLGSDDDLVVLLQRQGFEPDVDDGGTVRLRNCPFHRLAQHHTELICGMNLAMLAAVTADVAGVEARLDPTPGRCCVAFVPP